MANGEGHFTRATWHAGTKRRLQLRQRDYGGQKIASVAFVVAGGGRFTVGRPKARLCRSLKRDGTPCGMLALKGLPVCGAHGGFMLRAKQGIHKKSGKRQMILAERQAKLEPETVAASVELVRLRVYREASHSDRLRLAKAWQTDQWLMTLKQLKQLSFSRDTVT